ncbi:MAG TPA: alanine--tRNA ligase [Gemmataceae bacterium]|nr:alanine--tRNA ligase [Gemmataceae bacterium]
MPTSTEIRQQFIDFFCKKHGHHFVPSSPVVPLNDPTLLFANAGMNQFKPYFLGTEKPQFKRVANTQKCIRAGGKHNDLDDVGKDTYHHTFFEMLGNWSFGDYFKKEAIRWAWELLTEVWKLDKSRLHATVFEGSPDEGVPRDGDAFELWKSETDIDPSHIHWGNKKDNFWEMGETGPCGPCSEIHIDRTPDKSGGKLVNAGTPDVIEIWNLVFIQYNRGGDGKLTSLPAKHVDTGMGFERVTAVIQGKESNYDTDVFTPLFEAIQKVTGAPPYTGKLDDLKDTAYRVIADHIRALTFALTDAAKPSNVGRGYVLRSILRRAERYGRQYLGATEPFLHELVPMVVEVMGGAFPELRKGPAKVAATILDEEKGFLRTLDRGLKLFQEVVKRTCEAGSKVISGKDAFDLHTTYGLYIDITEQMAAEIGMTVDRREYERLFEDFQTQTGKDRKKFAVSAVSGELPKTDDSPKYLGLAGLEETVGWIKDNAVATQGRLEEGDEAALLLDRTCFYAEQGGQVGDSGRVTTPTGTFEVDDTQKLGDAILHVGRVVDGVVEPGQQASLEVASVRADTMRNHTATHLLNWALRRVLGEHVEQKGSLVDAEKTRFDFAHEKALSKEEIAEIERLVNEKIYADLPVTPVIMPLAQAKKIPGVRAVFGEKYPDPVRVLLVGAEKPEDATPEDSVEFCGGTHLNHTGQTGFFKIVSQEQVAKGVRRVTAVTGEGAVYVVQRMAGVLDELAGRFNCKPEEVPARVESLQEEVKKLQQQLRKGTAGDLQSAADRLFAEAVEVKGTKVIAGELPAAPVDQMLQQADQLKQKAGSAVVVLGWANDGKVQLLAAVTKDLTKKGVHAGKLVGEVAKVVGGKGGGKPEMAQAGGKDPAKLAEAMQQAKKLATEQLTG